MPRLRALSVAAMTTTLCVIVTASSPGRAGPRVPRAAPARLVTEGGAPAASLLTEDPSGTRYLAVGAPLRRADHFRAGSVTKTFVTTVVLRLAAEDRLRLGDLVDRYLPGLVRGHGNDGRRRTLRSLPSHTSGLFNYTADTTVPVALGPGEAIRTALAHSLGRLGTYAYSNTNYVLLGQIIQAVTGRACAVDAPMRLTRLCGRDHPSPHQPPPFTGTSLPGARTTLPEPHSRACTSNGRDITELDSREAGASGELISTLADLSRFYAALRGGALLPSGPAPRTAWHRRHPGRVRPRHPSPAPGLRPDGVGATAATPPAAMCPPPPPPTAPAPPCSVPMPVPSAIPPSNSLS
ncbi:serine hydrolase domain-containing protein [Streptomyces sp. NPDC006711]|uniref:serine hydrolase domain-containing protein n=1 Tax=Streptomyces sp. NPDC006711 TaxID=3364762 RepID=UPI0036B019A2